MVASRGRSESKRQTVESCLTLAIELLARERVLLPKSQTSGTLYWTNAAGEQAAWVGYEADMTDPARSWLRLRFRVPDPQAGKQREVYQTVPLTATRPHLGGQRWWFVDDGHRVGRLYLPVGSDRFRCRRALGLVYASQYRASDAGQERHSQDWPQPLGYTDGG
jgi:hypothetical protein